MRVETGTPGYKAESDEIEPALFGLFYIRAWARGFYGKIPGGKPDLGLILSFFAAAVNDARESAREALSVRSLYIMSLEHCLRRVIYG